MKPVYTSRTHESTASELEQRTESAIYTKGKHGSYGIVNALLHTPCLEYTRQQFQYSAMFRMKWLPHQHWATRPPFFSEDDYIIRTLVLCRAIACRLLSLHKPSGPIMRYNLAVAAVDTSEEKLSITSLFFILGFTFMRCFGSFGDA